MTYIELTVDIKADAQTVWNSITDWPTQGQWMLGTRVWTEGGPANGVGGTIAAFTGIGKLGFLDTMEITVWEPPVRCEVLHTGKVVRGSGIFVVEPTSQTTCRFVWSEVLDLPFGVIGRLGFVLVRPFFVAGVRQSLNRFARLVERAV